MHINFKIYDIVLIALFVAILGIKFFVFPEAEYLTALALTIFAVGILHIIRSNQSLIDKTYLQGQKHFDIIEKGTKENKTSLLKSIYKEFQFLNFLIKKESDQLSERTNYAIESSEEIIKASISQNQLGLSQDLQSILQKIDQSNTHNTIAYKNIIDNYNSVKDYNQKSREFLKAYLENVHASQSLHLDKIVQDQSSIKNEIIHSGKKITDTRNDLINVHKSESTKQLIIVQELVNESSRLHSSFHSTKEEIIKIYKEENIDQKQIADTILNSFNSLATQLIDTKSELSKFHLEGNLDFMQGINNLLASHESLSTQIKDSKEEILELREKDSSNRLSKLDQVIQNQEEVKSGLSGTKHEIVAIQNKSNSTQIAKLDGLVNSNLKLSEEIKNSKEEILEFREKDSVVSNLKLENIFKLQEEVKSGLISTKQELITLNRDAKSEQITRLDGLIHSTINLSNQLRDAKKDLVQLHSDNLSSHVENANSLQESYKLLQIYVAQAHNEIINLQKENSQDQSSKVDEIIKLYSRIEKAIPDIKFDLLKEQKVTTENINTILSKNTELIDSILMLNNRIEHISFTTSNKDIEQEVVLIKNLLQESIDKLSLKIETVRDSETYNSLLSNFDDALGKLLKESRSIHRSTQKTIDKEINKVVKTQDQNFYNLKYEILNGLDEKQDHFLTSITNESVEEKIILGNIYINTIIQKLSQEPIIIGGCGRSGSTLLLSMLSAHPKILAIPEETYVFSPDAYNPKMHHDNPFDVNKLYSEHISKLEILPTQDRWCEKSPKNVLFFDRILEYYPSARIIHLVRDGRDVILSKHPRNPNEYWISEERWIQDVTKGLELIDHPNVLTIKYEDLILNYDETMSVICNHIRVDFNYHLKKWHRFAKIRSNEAWFGEVEPIYSSSIGRWKNKENQHKIQKFLQNKRATNILNELKYDLPESRTKLKKINA